ncbi:MAG: 2-alkenal reductase [Ignavibacteria bacterium RIFCSPLOWO2_02_FULL_55_14]|nr:MAG: 2-alkenal reductase [Ignavibacteria bacterium RIFCSPLOWO2_02_FULL_55_14]
MLKEWSTSNTKMREGPRRTYMLPSKNHMRSPYVRIAIIIAIPLMAGLGIGYALHPSDTAAAGTEQVDGTFVEAATSRAVTETSPQQQEDIAVSRRNAITRAVAAVSPSVVGINVTEIRQYRDPMSRFFGDDPLFRQFFGDRTYQQEVKGLGSGFIISSDGYIITNDHVAGNAAQITVTMTDGRRLKAELVGTDGLTDISLLKVDGKDFPNVTLGNSDDIVIGEWAIALGNPFGLFEINDKPTVTVGVISSTGMNLGSMNNRYYRDMIETDAAINGGNSGGPLVNSSGEVIGMNTLIFTGGQTSTYVGYGFAIPVNKVKKVVDELKMKGKVSRDISTGLDVQPVDARIARYFGMREVSGVIISDLRAGGPGDKAGLKVGDIILEVNGDKVKSEEDIISVLVDSSPGDILKLKVYRDKKTMDVSMKLERS